MWPASQPIKFTPRLSHHREYADHGWLKAFHTFSSYGSGNASQGPLRLLNEGILAPKTGFGKHSHREFEILSYIVSGELSHTDSMGKTEILPRGSIQMTSAGTGITHSEVAHGSPPAHVLQIWADPHTRGLTPSYYTRHFSDSAKQNKWARIIAPDNAEGIDKRREAEGPAPVHSTYTMYGSLLDEGVKLPLEMKGRKGYVHIVMMSGHNVSPAQGATVRFASGKKEVTLREGDGAYLDIPSNPSELVVENVGDRQAELLVFDITE